MSLWYCSTCKLIYGPSLGQCPYCAAPLDRAEMDGATIVIQEVNKE